MATLGQSEGFLAVGESPQHTHPLPREIGMLLQRVLTAIASGETVTVTSVPEELTTSAAAALLSISRPTLMKMIAEGHLPSYKVGSHTRLRSADVLAFRQSRRERERAAFALLLEVEGDEE
jgi:excisionase family DNA binding protein